MDTFGNEVQTDETKMQIRERLWKCTDLSLFQKADPSQKFEQVYEDNPTFGFIRVYDANVNFLGYI